MDVIFEIIRYDIETENRGRDLFVEREVTKIFQGLSLEDVELEPPTAANDPGWF